jgi:hypothetical protein
LSGNRAALNAAFYAYYAAKAVSVALVFLISWICQFDLAKADENTLFLMSEILQKRDRIIPE